MSIYSPICCHLVTTYVKKITPTVEDGLDQTGGLFGFWFAVRAVSQKAKPNKRQCRRDRQNLSPHVTPSTFRKSQSKAGRGFRQLTLSAPRKTRHRQSTTAVTSRWHCDATIVPFSRHATSNMSLRARRTITYRIFYL